MALSRGPGDTASTAQPVIVEAGRLEMRRAGNDLADECAGQVPPEDCR